MDFLKVSFVGDPSVGKTCLIHRLMNPDFQEFPPSVGIGYYQHTIRWNDKNLNFQFYDTAGQQRFRDVTPAFIKGSNLVAACFDKANIEQFPQIIEFLINHGLDTCVIVVGCKKDELSPGDEKEMGRVKELVDAVYEENESPITVKDYIWTSAKTGDSIDDLQQRIAEYASQNIFSQAALVEKDDQSTSCC